MSQPYHYPPPPPAVRPPRWGRFAAWTGAAAVAAFAIGGGLGIALNDEGTDLARCKTALSEICQETMAAGSDAEPTTETPAPCVGVDEVTMQRLMGEVFSEYLDSPGAAEDMRRRFEEGMASAAGQP